MKKHILLILLFINSADLFASNYADSTMLRSHVGKYLKYVVLPENMKDDSAVISVVKLQRGLLFAPEKVNLEIEIYNILYKNQLAVFSLMPSYKSLQPTWAKINPDTIKDKTIDLKDLKGVVTGEIKKYPSNPKAYNNLKHWNYALLIKKQDGWFCSNSDCFTEFFEIIDNAGRTKNYVYQINLTAPQLSVAEYESAYKRIHGYYSTNTKSLMGYNEDVKNGDLLYQSYIENINNEKKYHFWLLGEWEHHGLNTQRGTDRFIFVPGTGIVSASYDCFIPDMLNYWLAVYHKKYPSPANSQTVIPAQNPDRFYRPLENYFIEYTIPAVPVKK